MRFIHTADWHLGRSFYNTSLIEDQAYALNQLIDLAKDAKPDLLIIAGDIYDRAIPSTDAVELLDDTLFRMIHDIKITVLLIAGNHDSPQRLQFGARLLEHLKLHVFGTLPERNNFIQMYDEAGPVCFYAMPYAEPSIIRQHLKDDQITNHDTGIRAWANLVRGIHSPIARSVIVTHAFVSGGEACDSERPLSVGSAGTVDVTCFEGFHYAALGHLHRPQSLANDQIHYSGSLLKYSFSEASHSKSVNLVDMDALGQCRVERIPLTARRDVRCVDGLIAEILSGKANNGNRNDFVKIRLSDRGAILDAMGKLREVYPNVMEIERAAFMVEPSHQSNRVDYTKSDVTSLFAAFYLEVTGEALTDEQATVFSSVVDKMLQDERGA